MRTHRLAASVGALACLWAFGWIPLGCGNPTNPDIVYKKLTPEEFAKLPPEEQETPEVQENMGADWKDPNDPRYATNPKRGRKR